LEVRVDDIDPQGKVSLSLVGDEADGNGSAPAPSGSRSEESSAPAASSDATSSDTVSFEDFFEEEARKEFGDLGPADTGARQGGGRGDSGTRRNPRRGG